MTGWDQLLHLPITALGRPDALDDAIRFQSGEVLFYRLGADAQSLGKAGGTQLAILGQ